ncbi:eukaryotic peptide chain release factor subunit 1-3 [Tanacetum coccineum]
MIVWIWMIILDTTLLAYVNGDHEYALFNPYGTDMHEWKIRPTNRVSGLEGTCMTMSKDHFYIGLSTRVQVRTIRALQYGKLKQLIKELKDGKGKDTCLISLIMEPGDEISQVSKMLDDICGTASRPRNGCDLRGTVVVDSTVRPQNGFHQAMRPKKITIVLEMKESAKNDLELNGIDIVPLYFGIDSVFLAHVHFYVMKSVCVEGFPGEGTQIENIMSHEVNIRRKELYSEATSGGNAAADPFNASAGGADDDYLYN